MTNNTPLESVQKAEPKIGSFWRDQYGSMRVLAIVEGYPVVRRRGGMPFVYGSLRKFHSECVKSDC